MDYSYHRIDWILNNILSWFDQRKFDKSRCKMSSGFSIWSSIFFHLLLSNLFTYLFSTQDFGLAMLSSSIFFVLKDIAEEREILEEKAKKIHSSNSSLLICFLRPGFVVKFRQQNWTWNAPRWKQSDCSW